MLHNVSTDSAKRTYDDVTLIFDQRVCGTLKAMLLLIVPEPPPVAIECYDAVLDRPTQCVSKLAMKVPVAANLDKLCRNAGILGRKNRQHTQQ